MGGQAVPDCAGFVMGEMKKYGLVKNGLVQSWFYTDKTPTEFPDIEPYLMELPEEVGCNWLFDGDGFVEPVSLVVEIPVIRPWWKFWG